MLVVLQARNSMDSSKYNFQNLSNPQRILFGLKVAALKSKPISGQQLEGKRKIDLSQVLTPILHTKECDDDVKPQPLQNHPSFLIVSKIPNLNVNQIYVVNIMYKSHICSYQLCY